MFRLGNESEKKIDPGKIFIHPKYVDEQAYYDIAVVKVDQIDYSHTTQPICIQKRYIFAHTTLL
jgi:hypothetical protein